LCISNGIPAFTMLKFILLTQGLAQTPHCLLRGGASSENGLNLRMASL
jgi:hypothetical protein